jgi:hypothetical protein
MNARHRRTLEAVFEEPTSAGIVWREVESMLEALGAHVEERKGSAVAVLLRGHVAVFHRPHPQKEARRYAIRALREFLILVEVTP